MDRLSSRAGRNGPCKLRCQAKVEAEVNACQFVTSPCGTLKYGGRENHICAYASASADRQPRKNLNRVEKLSPSTCHYNRPTHFVQPHCFALLNRGRHSVGSLCCARPTRHWPPFCCCFRPFPAPCSCSPRSDSLLWHACCIRTAPHSTVRIATALEPGTQSQRTWRIWRTLLIGIFG